MAEHEPARPGSKPAPGRLRRAFTRLASSTQELEAEELRVESVGRGCTPIAEAAPRTRVVVSGTLRTVTLRPRAGVPALVADLYDGSGSVAVVWLGRRRIAGIEPGRSLVATGRIALMDGVPTMFNPQYTLLPPGRE